VIDIEQILAKPLAETFTATGLAPNIMAAHNLAWDALNESLGTDAVRAWQLKAMQHQHSTDPKGVAFVAEFARDPHYEVAQIVEES
jgi:hypothetical protein